MCLGVVPWSGVRHPICGTRSEDAEVVGFDERPKRAEWVRSLEECGVTAERDVLRDEAASMLRWYAEEAVRPIAAARHLDSELLGEVGQVAATVLCNHDEVLDADAAHPRFVEAGLYRHHVAGNQLLVGQ